MALQYEQEIKDDLARKNVTLAALARMLRGWTASDPVPVVELMAALEEARAALRDCAVCWRTISAGSSRSRRRRWARRARAPRCRRGDRRRVLSADPAGG